MVLQMGAVGTGVAGALNGVGFVAVQLKDEIQLKQACWFLPSRHLHFISKERLRQYPRRETVFATAAVTRRERGGRTMKGQPIRALERFYRLGFTFEGNLGRYLYEPLHSPDALRLLQIEPGHRDADIECELITTRLDQSPRYEALSYCWGDAEVTRDIQCNGQTFEVTANLHDALARMRQSNQRRTIWADAACINQRDYAERNSQLLLMKRIYRNASRVSVWLGRENESTGLVRDILCRLRELGQSMEGPIHLGATEDLHRFGLPPQSAPVWSALRYFFRRPWFERAWVIQEAVNAPELRVMCGSVDLNWDDIAFTARCIAESPMFATTDTARICQHVQFIDQRRTALQQGRKEGLSLLDLLQGSRRCDATDLRDKVYGLYPLVENEALLLPPDYTKPVDVIYRETAAHIIKKSGKLDVLGYAGAARHPKTRALGLPSWVPDWHSYEKAAVPLVSVFSGNSSHEADFEFSKDLNQLNVKACVLGEIESLSDTMQPYQGSIKGERVDSILDWLNGQTTLEPSGEQVDIVSAIPDSDHLGTSFKGTEHVPMADAVSGQSDVKTIKNDMMKLLYGRRVFRCRGGSLGLTSSYATAGDQVVHITGVGVPFVVRPTASGGYSLIGECFLSGYMAESKEEGLYSWMSLK